MTLNVQHFQSSTEAGGKALLDTSFRWHDGVKPLEPISHKFFGRDDIVRMVKP